MFRIVKVHLFWEGRKNVRNLPYAFDIYLVNVKTIRQIAKLFVVFSEKLNFINIVLKKCVPFLVHLLFCRPFSQVLQCRVWTNLYHCLFAFSWKVPLLHHRANLLPLTISTVLNIWKEKEIQVKNSVNFFKLRKEKFCQITSSISMVE